MLYKKSKKILIKNHHAITATHEHMSIGQDGLVTFLLRLFCFMIVYFFLTHAQHILKFARSSIFCRLISDVELSYWEAYHIFLFSYLKRKVSDSLFILFLHVVNIFWPVRSTKFTPGFCWGISVTSSVMFDWFLFCFYFLSIIFLLPLWRLF